MSVSWKEAVANGGRFGYRLDEDGKRVGHPIQFGEPFVWQHAAGSRECMKWSNGVSEGFVVLANVSVEWLDN